MTYSEINELCDKYPHIIIEDNEENAAWLADHKFLWKRVWKCVLYIYVMMRETEETLAMVVSQSYDWDRDERSGKPLLVARMYDTPENRAWVQEHKDDIMLMKRCTLLEEGRQLASKAIVVWNHRKDLYNGIDLEQDTAAFEDFAKDCGAEIKTENDEALLDNTSGPVSFAALRNEVV